ncbi:hypothetical protein HAPAU_31900 [Halalkalicoccus paucihalophilus]|uniref:Uncharacterized protein n=1 Tax=Halalkalicoccus paucihalophilus TaxID=1008153 RepID=A0A151AB23_9EURY|nr:hypothetical protein HAPAU_31900 [Halalkalicoccus paucihalophilus]
MPENEIRHHLAGDLWKWCSPRDVVECLPNLLWFKLLVEAELFFFSHVYSRFEQFH